MLDGAAEHTRHARLQVKLESAGAKLLQGFVFALLTISLCVLRFE
jgi:tetrahydromethanopterin S-methyltransferase subunit F